MRLWFCNRDDRLLKLRIDITSQLYFEELVDSVIGIYDGVYPEVQESRSIIIQTIFGEATKYQKAISVGKKEWQKILAKDSNFFLYIKSSTP